MMDTTERRYLVLVVGMLAGPGPAAEVYRLSKKQPSRFHFIVPATRPDYGWTWSEGQAIADARQRLEIMLEFGSAMGMEVTGDVARTDDPVDAARTAAEGFDEIILIDNPHGLRHWRSDRALADLAVAPGLPMHHFEANPPLKQGKHFDTDELREHFRRFLDDLKRSEGRGPRFTRPTSDR
jgi:hypothetical protein